MIRNALLLTMMIASSTLLASVSRSSSFESGLNSLDNSDDHTSFWTPRVRFSQEQATSSAVGAGAGEDEFDNTDDVFSFTRRVHFSQQQATSSAAETSDIDRFWEDAEQAWLYPPESIPHNNARTIFYQAALEEFHPKRMEALVILWHSDDEDDKSIARSTFTTLMTTESIGDSDKRLIIMRFKGSKNTEDKKQGQNWNRQFFPHRPIKVSSPPKKCAIM